LNISFLSFFPDIVVGCVETGVVGLGVSNFGAQII